MEELRDDKIGEILTKFQSYIRAKFAKEKYQKIVNERDGALVVQANWRAYMNLKVSMTYSDNFNMTHGSRWSL